MKWICLTVDKQLHIKELSLSYPAKSRLSPVKLENELKIEQIKWETLAVGRQIIWLYGQGSEPWTQILRNYDYCSSGQSRTSTPRYLIFGEGGGCGGGASGLRQSTFEVVMSSCRLLLWKIHSHSPCRKFLLLSWLNEPSLPTCTCIKFWQPVALCCNDCNLFSGGEGGGGSYIAYYTKIFVYM